MIALGNSTTTITATLGGAITTNQVMCTVHYEDEPASVTGIAVAVHNKQLTLTNGATPVTILAAGPGGTATFRRKVKSIQIFNNDTVAQTITLQIVDTASSTMTLQQATLQTLEQLNYEEGFGFEALDINGAVKSQAAATSSATSTALSTTVSFSTAQSTKDSNFVISFSTTASVALSQVTSESVLVSTVQSNNTLSFSTTASTALSEATSVSVVASANLSTFTVASGTTSSTESLRTSAGNSVTLSKTKSSFSF